MVSLSLLAKNNRLMNASEIDWTDTFKQFLGYTDEEDLLTTGVKLNDIPKAFFLHFERIIQTIPGLKVVTEDFSQSITALLDKIKGLNSSLIFTLVGGLTEQTKDIIARFDTMFEEGFSDFINNSFALQFIMTKVRLISGVFRRNFFKSQLLKIDQMLIEKQNPLYDPKIHPKSEATVKYFNLGEFESIWNNTRYAGSAFTQGDLPLMLDRIFGMEVRRLRMV